MPQTVPVLLVSPESALAERVRRVAAAAGRPVTHVVSFPDAAVCRSADVVVLTAEVASAATVPTFSAHTVVIVVTDAPPGVSAWHAAATLRTPHVLELPTAEGALMALLTAPARASGGSGVVVAVVGGCGGAGASVFSTALAEVAARTRRTILVDGDADGGGLDLVAGLDDLPGLRWPDVVIEGGRVTADSLHHALPCRGDLAVLSTRRENQNPLSENAIRAVIEAGRAAGELVVCDTPRNRSPVRRSVVEVADLVVMVVPASVRASAAGQAIAEQLRAESANVGLVVRGPSPGGLTASEIAEIVGLPLLASVRPERRLAARLDARGLALRGRSPLVAAASDVLALLGISGTAA